MEKHLTRVSGLLAAKHGQDQDTESLSKYALSSVLSTTLSGSFLGAARVLTAYPVPHNCSHPHSRRQESPA